MLEIILNTEFLASVLRMTAPILFAALASLIAQQSGITNMAVEGVMLFAALMAAIGTGVGGNAFIGVFCGIGMGIAISLLLAYFKMRMRADEILIAIAINMLASGATLFILFIVTGDRSTSAKLGMNSLPSISIPLVERIPIIGNIISGQNLLVYVSFFAVVFIYILLYKTPLGLRIRAVGSNPDAAVSTGVSVEGTRYIALTISGILAGLGGSYMSLGYMKVFTKNMVAGRGFIGLAAASVGNMNPVGSMLASFLFGTCSAVADILQSTGIPVEFINMTPYIVTIASYSLFTYRIRYGKNNNKKLVRSL
ncbi:MAG: ABC transporter permease [Lachnospirales bacterium]